MMDTEKQALQQVEKLFLGKFSEIEKPNSDAPELLQAIYRLAGKSIERADESLRRTADISIAMNRGVSEVARMSGHIHDVDHHSQTIASAIEELSASVKAISQSATQASGEVNMVSDSATHGIDAANRAQGAMSEIAQSVHSASERVSLMAKSSEEIGQIIKDIEDIAKQTNLLALNATIEAARAGEAGKGFAVVASEVKSLAKQTATATDTIRTRIANLRGEMNEIVTSMDEGEQKVADGQEVIQASTGQMQGISEQVASVHHHMSEINIILEQQVMAADEVSSGAACYCWYQP